MSVCIYVYVYISACMYVRTNVCMYICMYVLCIYACMYVCMYVRVCALSMLSNLGELCTISHIKIRDRLNSKICIKQLSHGKND